MDNESPNEERSASDVSEYSDRDSCLGEVLESDDPDLSPTADGRAMAERLASEVRKVTILRWSF